MKINYLLEMQAYFKSFDHTGELTDEPLACINPSALIYTWYDAKEMKWKFSRKSKISYLEGI